MKNWTYNKDTDAWVFGESNHGGGVFLDKPVSKKNEKEVWTGNAVANGVISNIGDCKSRGQAMSKVEAEFNRMTNQY